MKPTEIAGMKFAEMSVESLAQAKAEYNPRKISDHDFRALRRSMQSFGVVEPIVFNRRTGKVVGGHQRIDAAAVDQPEGTLPVVIVDLDEARERALNIALNRISGEWDKDLLAETLAEIESEEILKLTGFEFGEVESYLRRIEPSVSEPGINDVEEPPAAAFTRKGDVWILDGHRIVCGDATSAEAYASLLGQDSVDLAFTSPPYNTGSGLEYHDGRGRFFYDDPAVDAMDEPAYVSLLVRAAERIGGVLSEAGSFLLNLSYSAKTQDAWVRVLASLLDCGWNCRELVAWIKGSSMPTPGHRMVRRFEPIFFLTKHEDPYFVLKGEEERLTNVWDVPSLGAQQENLRACFPVELPARAISRYCPRSGSVLDPFLGSGSTLIAADRLGRRCFGVELNPRYVDASVARWQRITGKAAERESDGAQLPALAQDGQNG